MYSLMIVVAPVAALHTLVEVPPSKASVLVKSWQARSPTAARGEQYALIEQATTAMASRAAIRLDKLRLPPNTPRSDRTVATLGGEERS